MYSDDERYELLSQFAYQSWMDRGQPIGSPEIDWAMAEEKLAAIEALDAASDRTAASQNLLDSERAESDEIPALNFAVERRRRKSASAMDGR